MIPFSYHKVQLRLLPVLYLLFYPSALFSQVSFEPVKTPVEWTSKLAKADSAIRAGEFGTIHSLLVLQDGRLVFEQYYNNWPKDSLHQLQSATKSVVATLLGCAIREKFIRSVEEPIYTYFPRTVFSDPLRRRIRILDLLTQRHGLAWQEGDWNSPENSWRNVLSTPGDWYGRILETPMDTLPGIVFNYSNAAPALVSAIIQKAAAMPIDSFAIRFLFKKLGIQKYWFWPGNGGPSRNGMALISLTSRDMARIGQLYLQEGYWEGHPVIPPEFVSLATSPVVKAVGRNGYYKQYDYGFFWWINPVTTNNSYSEVFLARGAGGQNIIVDRKRKWVVVITAWNMQQPNKPQMIYDKYLGG